MSAPPSHTFSPEQDAPRRDSRARQRSRIRLAAITAVFLAWAGFFIYQSSFVAEDGRRYFCLFDDAMISMRYAWNLAHGQGLVWNPGERVEGYTNLLMTLTMGGLCRIFGRTHAILAVQVFGVACAVAAAGLIRMMAANILRPMPDARRLLVQDLCYFSCLAYYPLAYWALLGMESGLQATLLYAGLLVALRSTELPRSSWRFVLFMGLAILTRPDALVPVALLTAYRVWRGRSQGRVGGVAAEIGVLVAVILGMTLFRHVYYGDIVPNTYRLKIMGIPLLTRLANGWAFLRQYLPSASVALALSMCGFLFDYRPGFVLLCALVGASYAYQIWVGGDAWIHWRMLAPYVPLLSVAAIVELDQVVETVMGSRSVRSYVGRNPLLKTEALRSVVLAAGVLGLLVVGNRRFAGEIVFKRPAYTVDNNRDMVRTGLALGEICRPGASIAVMWAGSIPYYSGLRAIDILGKSDRYIASLPPHIHNGPAYYGMKVVPGHSKFDLTYSIITQHPTYTQLVSWGDEDVTDYVAAHFVRVRRHGVELLLRKESPYVDWEAIPGDSISAF